MKAIKTYNMDGKMIRTTRTFNSEEDAVEKVLAWQMELEAEGWALHAVRNTGEIVMSKLFGRKLNWCKLITA